MLRHRYIVILFIFLMALPFLVDYFSKPPLLYFVLVTAAFLSIEFYGAYVIDSKFHLKTICKGETSEKLVALTFDDGPGIETLAILDLLKETRTPATFFCIGSKIKNHEAILKRMDAEGHTIGNHSFHHGFFIDFKLTNGFIKELKETNSLITSVIGKTPQFFRPPYAVTTPALARALKKLNLFTIGWNIRSFDTSIQDKQVVLQRIKKRLKPGAIILLHDTIEANAILVKDVLDYLKEQQYQVDSLETLINKKAYV